MKHLIVIICCFSEFMVIGGNVFSQNPSQFALYTVSDGLETNFARGIVQDKMGYLWFDHDSHVSRFDGYEFKNFRHDPDDPLMNLGRELNGRILIDNNGDFWINNLANAQANGKILKYDHSLDGFVSFNPSVNHFVNIIIAESDASFWLGTRDGGGVYKFDIGNGTTSNYLNRSSPPELQTSDNHIFTMEQLGQALLLSTKNGLWIFDKTSSQFRRPPLSGVENELLFEGVVIKIPNKQWVVLPDRWEAIKLDSNYSVVEKITLPNQLRTNAVDWSVDHDDKFWFLSAEGLFRFDPVLSNTEQIFDNSASKEFLSELFIDRDNSVWFTGEAGIRRLIRSEFAFQAARVDKSGLSRPDALFLLQADEVSKMFVAGGGNFGSYAWLSSTEGENINIHPFDFKGKADRSSNLIDAWKGRNFFWVAAYGRGVIRFSLDIKTGLPQPDNVLYLEHDPGNPNTISTDETWAVYEDKDGILWVGTFNGLNRIDQTKTYGSEGSVSRYYNEPGDTLSLNSNIVRQIVPHDEESFWVVTELGVDLFSKGRFKKVFDGRERIGYVHESGDGFLYVGTFGGLYRSIGKNDYSSFIKTGFSERIDLPFLEDSEKRLWISSRQGLLLYDPAKNYRITFGDQNDFKDTGGMVCLPDGRIVLCLFDGIALFDPLSVQPSLNSVEPVITNLWINNSSPGISGHSNSDNMPLIPADVNFLDELLLDYTHNNVSFRFSAMEMIAPAKNRYRHKLEGFDPGWIETDSKSRTAAYTNLSPGRYVFKVKASNRHGVWSEEEKTLTIKVLPPVWRTNWAYSLYCIVMFGLLLGARKAISEREKLKANLRFEQIEHEKAKEVDKAKNSFFTNISHEFRTPLTLIKGPVRELMSEFGADPKAQKHLRLIERNSDLLLKYVNQLLALAKLESGSMTIEKSKIDLDVFLRALMGSFSSLAEQKRLFFRQEFVNTSQEVVADANKFETIIANLVSNAIKFTPEGGQVIVMTKYCLLDDGRGDLFLGVTDTGIGIREEEQLKIFERFYQVKTGVASGTGIGLALAKELVILLGGSIELTSTPGEGTEFRVHLPIDPSEKPGALPGLPKKFGYPSERIEPSDPGFVTHSKVDEKSTKPSILVVEDNRDLRKFIIDSFGDEFSFLEAVDGQQGLEIAAETLPDVIVSDIMMPKIDGVSMTAEIRKSLQTSHIPIILLTAKSSDESRISGLETGADDYLTKPFNKQELLIKIRNIITRQIRLRERLRIELMSVSPRLDIPSADGKFLSQVKKKILDRIGDESLGVDALARDIGMSRVQLYRKVSALTGLSVNELIRKLRLHRASQLLEQKWGPVSQVAYEVGFSNLSYFSRIFKDEFGVLPSVYPPENADPEA